MTPPTPLCEKLPWDSQFFGLNIARVLADTLTEPQAAAIDAWCHSQSIACLYFLACPDDPATVRTAQAHGYTLVDIRVELEKSVPQPPPPASATGPFEPPSHPPGAEPTREQESPRHAPLIPPTVRPATPADLPALEAIARISFTDSRFYADPHFPREKCDALYVRWIRESLRGFADAVLVAHHQNTPAGFITCKIKNTPELPPSESVPLSETRPSGSVPPATGSIGLVGVAAPHRGQGLGPALIHAADAWFAAHNAPRITVVTQARNLHSQRLYQRHAFLTRSVGLYYHKWLSR